MNPDKKKLVGSISHILEADKGTFSKCSQKSPFLILVAFPVVQRKLFLPNFGSI